MLVAINVRSRTLIEKQALLFYIKAVPRTDNGGSSCIGESTDRQRANFPADLAGASRTSANANLSNMFDESTDKRPTTLGDLLYATSKAPIPEQDWVALVQSIAGGDQLALHALYERAHRPVFTLIMRITANRETAEELTIDVFHDVWRRASRYDVANGELIHFDDALYLRVMDSGSGFDPHSVTADRGLGLLNMEERLRLVGGELRINSQPSHGTLVEARIPLERTR